MSRKTRLLSLLLASLLFVFMVFSCGVIALSSHHDCVGEHCPVCAQISLCEKVLKTLGLAASFAGMAMAFRFLFTKAVSDKPENRSSFSLISLKVKLSD